MLLTTFFVLVQSLTTFAFAKDAFLQSGAISGDVYSVDDSYSYSLSTTLGNNYYDPITVVTGAVTQPRGGIEGAGACYIVQYTFPKVKIPVYSGGFEYPSPSLSYSSKLVPDQPSAVADNFGTDVSINGKGTLIAVGACSGCVKNTYSNFVPGKGKVFIFSITSSNTYSQRAIIVPNDAMLGDQFGSSVALASSANVLVACSPQANTGSSVTGACYVYTSSSSNPSGWTQVGKLIEPKTTSTITNAGNQFGGNCGGAAISGDGKVIVIGAPRSTVGVNNGARVGALYVFRAGNSAFTLWSTGFRLRQQTSFGNSLFGYMVTMTNDGTTIAVGAPQDSIGGVQKGSVEVFYTASPNSGSYTSSSWIWYQKITFSGSSQDGFGTGLALSSDGNTLSIGAPGKESVYTYTYNDNDPSSKYTFQGSDGALYPSNPQGGSQFGFNVKMDSRGFSLFVSAQTDFSQANSTYFPPLASNNQPIRSGALYSFSSGVYSASISGSTTSSSSSNSSQDTGAIVGGIFGPLFAIILFNVFYYMFCDKKASAPAAQAAEEAQVQVNPSAPPPPELMLRTISPPNQSQVGDANFQYGIPPQPMVYGGMQPNPYAQPQMQYGQYGMQPQYGIPQQVGYFVTSPTGQQQMVMMPVVMEQGGGGGGGMMMMSPEGQMVQVQQQHGQEGLVSQQPPDGGRPS